MKYHSLTEKILQDSVDKYNKIISHKELNQTIRQWLQEKAEEISSTLPTMETTKTIVAMGTPWDATTAVPGYAPLVASAGTVITNEAFVGVPLHTIVSTGSGMEVPSSVTETVRISPRDS